MERLTLGTMQFTAVVLMTLLIPVSYLFARAVLLLQQHGRLSRWDRWAGPLTWGMAMVLLGAAVMTDGMTPAQYQERQGKLRKQTIAY